MSTEPTGAAAPGTHHNVNVNLNLHDHDEPDQDHDHDHSTIAVVNPQPATKSPKHIGLHSPPDSNNVDATDSELSDLDEAIADADSPNATPAPARGTAPKTDSSYNTHVPAPTTESEQNGPEQVPTPGQDEDIGEVLPDHWSGTVPVFKPTMLQFKDFKKFMGAVDSYGMKSGIIKIIPPQEWRESLPDLDDLVKQIRVREPIKQDIMGSNGTYRQVNILHQRSYNVPQWKQLCDQSEHQPPARRGERRANAERPKPAPRGRAAAAANRSSTQAASSPARRGGRGRGRGRGRGSARGRGRKSTAQDDTDVEERPMTPESPRPAYDNRKGDAIVNSIEDPGVKVEEDECDEAPRRMAFSRQAKPKVQTTSARRKYSKREGSAMIDEEAFKDWDYRMDISDYTPERCEELERTYWKTLTYAQPLYGADLMGTLFHEDTELWNLNKLPNLLDVLGTKVPGVNTAYLYLGMWKATFAWHLEDVDLYSINYLHFGAPKQWYSISQADARRFEAAMKSIWPTEAKACDQFLRHKAFLISPSHLLQHYNIKVNKVLSYPGEFVVTYPYGYHSGYNLGYNCAEAVNFALDSWLPMGKIAKKCECAQAQDSVWVDVYEIERKLRGEPTPEYWTEEEEDSDADEDEDEEDDDEETGLPSPPDSHTVRIKASTRKRKRGRVSKEKKEKAKKLRLRVKAHVEPPCCLCPNDIPGAEILSTDDGRKAHRLCALYLPETYIETVDGEETVSNAAGIEKARLELKCLYCRSKRGACFQCSQKKCPRSYHATCAAAAGVLVEHGDVPVFDKDGIEYKEEAFEFSCRFHRSKRDRKLDAEALEENARIKEAAAVVKKGDICQMQFYRKEIFAGIVVENRQDEQTLLLDIIPNGSRVEVDWKWLLLPDPEDFHLPKASSNALPMPTSRKARADINAKRSADEPPRTGDMFVEGPAMGKDFTWSEFHTCEAAECKNNNQAKIDLSKDNQMWHYLGRTSTEAKAQYTEDPRKPQHNPKSNYLDSIPKPPPPPRPQFQASYGATHPAQARAHTTAKPEKPYVYKPRKPIDTSLVGPFAPPKFTPTTAAASGVPPLSFGTDPRFSNSGMYTANRHTPFATGLRPQEQPRTNAQFTPILPPRQPHQTPPPQQSQSINPAWLSSAQPSTQMAQVAPSVQPPPSRQNAPPSFSPAPMQSPNVEPQQPTVPMQQPTHARTPAPPAAPQAFLQAAPEAVPQQAWPKFSFFQAYHNRDGSRYRTPYAPWGGFCNGYEGDLLLELSWVIKPFPFQRSACQVAIRRGISHLFICFGHVTSTSAFPRAPARAIHSIIPITPGNEASQPTFLNTSPNLPPHVSFAATTPQPMDVDSEVHESPAQQLKQQLRRISDPKESPFRMPRSRGHTPRNSLGQLPRLRTPSQPADPAITQERRASGSQASQATTPSELAANGVSVREFPEIPAVDSQGLVQKMMLDLRRASMQSQQGAVDDDTMINEFIDSAAPTADF
ncbi:DNA damage-responsive transcriptional repressor RPH1 [Cytospora mali]|uniref:[histone H3]-trimethyl-L-lysine(9) demethylase n=1 Tax=Cytospora mali TaxID=578113 RepID=A0A194V4U4_CYTMA|nr:DNA damage-responsive transcriptional repressor RPH1 [Valsa mali var. pyri (nom. inval.)]